MAAVCPRSSSAPNSGAATAKPRSSPEYTVPYTRPVAPGGAARLMSMSRDGPAMPMPAPANATSARAAAPGSQPRATSSSSAAEASRQALMVFSSRATRPTMKPPTTMPAALHSM